MTDEKKNEKFDPVIYWAPASDYQIGNWVKEIRGGDGRTIQGEQPLRFSECIYVATTQAEVDFIEATTAFSNKVIRRCKDMAEARTLTSARTMKKQVTEYNTEVTVQKTFEGNNPGSIRAEAIAAAGEYKG